MPPISSFFMAPKFPNTPSKVFLIRALGKLDWFLTFTVKEISQAKELWPKAKNLSTSSKLIEV